MLSTRFTELVGCRVPLQLAAMPGVGTPSLVAAVARAGGLAMLGAPLLTPARLRETLDDMKSVAPGAIGVNFLMPFLDRACLEVAIPRARVIEFFYGDPDAALVASVHAGGALASWQVGSLEEAVAAVRAGCDLVVVQGSEAGGHVRGVVSLLPLLGEVLDALEVPVVAAGGIGSARAMAAALAMGAAAVRVGTRFAAAAESGAHPDYVAALIAAGPEDTVLTDAFSVMWPDAPHRVLRSCVEAAAHLESETAGEIHWGDGRMLVPRHAVIAPTCETTGAIQAMALYAGESVGAVERVEPAAAIVRELCEGAERLLCR